MEQNNQPRWAYKNEEERQLAEVLIGKERACLDKWFKGDTSGYAELWSKTNFSYFDIAMTERCDDYPTIAEFLKNLEGQLRADSYDMRQPRVQFGQDMAVLTYVLFSDTNLINMRYNVVEVFQKETDGEWRVIHSTWGQYRPMDQNWGAPKEYV